MYGDVRGAGGINKPTVSRVAYNFVQHIILDDDKQLCNSLMYALTTLFTIRVYSFHLLKERLVVTQYAVLASSSLTHLMFMASPVASFFLCLI